jgi:hypothetical protein
MTNPVSGKEGNIFDGGMWLQNIFGVIFFLIILNVGQKAANLVTSPTKGAVKAGLDTPITGSPVAATEKREVY